MSATSVGALLRSERVRRGMELSEVSTATRICISILQAMENEQFDSLPGGAYRRNFLRQYAHVLHLNEDEVVAQFYSEFQEPPLPLPVPPKTRPKRYLKEAGCFLLFVAGLFSLYQIGEAERRHRFAVLTSPVSAGANSSATSSAAAGAAPTSGRPFHAGTAPSAGPAMANAAVTTPLGSAHTAVAAADREALAEPDSGLAAATGLPGAQSVRVVFSTTEPVWVSVTCDGNLSFIGTVDGSEAKTFEGAARVTVLFGNAGGVSVSLNGQPIGPLGARGEIQLVEFTKSGARRLPRHSSPQIKAGEPQA